MAFLFSLFGRTLPDMAPEHPNCFKIHMNFSKAKESKIELDRRYFEMPVREILHALQMADKCLIVETFSKSNGKIIGRRKIGDFEKPFAGGEFLPRPGREDLKYKFCLVEPDEVKTFSTSQIINNRFKAQGARNDHSDHEPRVEREGVFQLKHDLASADEKKVHLFLTNQMIYFKYAHDKQRITHIPLLLIDEIFREEATKLSFGIVSAGVSYNFIGGSAESVRQWAAAIQDLRQQAKVRMSVQEAEQEIRASATRRANHMLGFRNLTKEEILENRTFRDSLHRYITRKCEHSEEQAENVRLLFDFLTAYDREDESDMTKILERLQARGVRLERLESESPEDLGMSERGVAMTGLSPVGDPDQKMVAHLGAKRERVQAELSGYFDLTEFLEFVFDECFVHGDPLNCPK